MTFVGKASIVKALVVGGGIAGPATALALERVGVDATVLEARPPSADQVGSWFTIAPNGLAALDEVGCLDLCRGLGFETRRNTMVGATGSILGTISQGRPLPDGTHALTMRRSRLTTALTREAADRGVEVRTGGRVVAVADDGDLVTATLEDGTVLVGDLLVGADGVHSVVRRAIDPSAPAARYVGLTNFGGITRRSPVADRLSPDGWHFVFGRRAFFGAHPTPDGDVVWFVNVPREQIGRDERTTTTPDQWLSWLGDLVSGDAGPAHELVRTGELELAADNTFDLGHVPTWHRGRLVLLGDAAHAPAPSSGQGASMALEDAVVLAAQLGRAADPVQALAGFEAARRRRVERIVAVGARSSSAKIPGRAARVVQEAAMRLVFRYAVTDRSQEWMTGHRVRL